MLRRIVLTLLLVIASLLGAAQVSEVASTRTTRKVPAFSTRGVTTLETSEVLLNVPFLDGTPILQAVWTMRSRRRCPI